MLTDVIGGELVREARKRAGLTQAELAARAGTTQSAIARLESGRVSPALEQVERLLKLCGFMLVVELAPYDDSDLVQAEANLRRAPQERVDRHDQLLQSVRELREAARTVGVG
jgi:transcriptional regulator with XRE-family HTH domain